MTKKFYLGADKMTAGKALAILNGKISIGIHPDTKEKITRCHKTVLAIADGQAPVYGINTGFGPLCDTIISRTETSKLQQNLLISHAVGVGEPISVDLAKLMMILKVQSLSQGHSGISMTIINRILWHIRNDVIPMVPSQGSLGASGDLAPLSHLFLPLIGLGKVMYRNRVTSTRQVLKKLGKKPLTLHPKAGLALINGTQFIAAHAVRVIEKLHSCLAQADLIGAMTIEGQLGSCSPYAKKLHRTRPYPGNIHVATRLEALISGSAINSSHNDAYRVQDPYSLRCMPQVHGASRTAWLHLKEALEIELNAVTDNPIIFSKGISISGGNFHGQPLALPLDYAGLAASEVGNISDRRSYFSLEGKTAGIPRLLVEKTGTNSGFMILQYTGASLVSENKSLCYPASADSIPTSLGQEDHVSMGSISARKTLRICENLEKILAVELMHACQALDFRKPLKPHKILQRIHDHVRGSIAHATEDRLFGEDLNRAVDMIQSKELLRIASRYADLATKYDTIFETW